MRSALPPVTIGIPFFNAETTLLDAVRSVFAQTHQDWELILVDDGSTDGSLALAKSIDDPRVRVYSDGRNRRLATRLNEISRLARFEYVARMDADDLMSRNRLETQLRLLGEKPQFDLVSSGVVSISDDWRPLGARCVQEGHSVAPREVLAGRSGIVHAAVLAKREWFLRNPYDETMKASEDTNLWIRACANGDLSAHVIHKPLYFYREDGNVVYPKLRQAYREHRRTVSSVSGMFSFRDRVFAYSLSGLKSVAAYAVHLTGRMDLVRARRNSKPLAMDCRDAVEMEIRNIRATPLPLRVINGAAYGH